MNAKALLFFIAASNLVSTNIARDDFIGDRCDYLGTSLYEDIGCKAVYDSKRSCPDRYSCPKNKNYPNICYHGGNRYNRGEKIDIESPSCLNCTCKYGYKQGNIVCKYNQCPPTPTPKEGCYYKRKEFECCATEEYCDHGTCEYNGQLYLNGKYFRLENTCQECYCSEDFKSKPYCRKVSCLSDIYHQREIKKRCAPNYIVLQDKEDLPLCCPTNYICEEDIIKATYITRGVQTKEEKCAFNGGYYNKEDSLNVSYSKTIAEEIAICSCRLPPFMTCITTYLNIVIRYDDKFKKRNKNNKISKKHKSKPISKKHRNNSISKKDKNSKKKDKQRCKNKKNVNKI